MQTDTTLPEGNSAMSNRTMYLCMPFDLAIPILKIHPEATPPTIRKYTGMRICIAALSVTVKYEKPFTCRHTQEAGWISYDTAMQRSTRQS